VLAGLAVIAITIPSFLVLGTGGSPAELHVTGATPAVRSASPAVSGGSATRPPAPTSASTRPAGRSVDGVEVTWLPPDLLAGDPNPYATSDAPIIPSPYARGASVHRLSVSSVIHGQVGFVDVDVQRGPVPTLDAAQNAVGAMQPGRTFARSSVRGHEALVTRMNDKNEFSLVWAESDDLLLAVTAGSPVTDQDLRAVAAGLRVGAAPAPADPAPAHAIGTAVRQAFTGGATAADLVTAVEGGAGLATVPGQLAVSYPGLVATARVGMLDVEVTGASTAVAVFTLTFDEPKLTGGFIYTTADAAGTGGVLQHQDMSVRAVRMGLGWRVSRDGYCQIVRLVGARC
jgi:hypothetical protein